MQKKLGSFSSYEFQTKVDPESGEPTDFLDQAALDWCRNLGINAELVVLLCFL